MYGQLSSTAFHETVLCFGFLSGHFYCQTHTQSLPSLLDHHPKCRRITGFARKPCSVKCSSLSLSLSLSGGDHFQDAVERISGPDLLAQQRNSKVIMKASSRRNQFVRLERFKMNCMQAKSGQYSRTANRTAFEGLLISRSQPL